MIELQPEDVVIGQSADTMERIALRLIGRVTLTGYTSHYHGPDKPASYTHNLPAVCERTTQPLPHGCWDDGRRSPYAAYSDDRWCDSCIAYAALNGTLPRPVITIDISSVPRLVGAA